MDRLLGHGHGDSADLDPAWSEARVEDAGDLEESGDVRSSSTLLVNAHFAYRLNQRWLVRFSVFNLLDREDNDIEYYYPSLLPGEAPGPDEGGYNDIHFHTVEPFALRLGLTAAF